MHSFDDGYPRGERHDQQCLETGLENENPQVDVPYVGAANQSHLASTLTALLRSAFSSVVLP